MPQILLANDSKSGYRVKAAWKWSKRKKSRWCVGPTTFFKCQPRRRNLWVIFSLWSGNPSPSLDVDVSVSGMEDTSVPRRQAALEPGQGQAAAFCSLA